MDLRHIGFSGFHVAAETAIVCLFLAFTVLLALIFYPAMFCCHRQKSSPKAPNSPYLKRDSVGKVCLSLCRVVESAFQKSLFALMLARLEEFDQLTPLVTPASSVAMPPFGPLSETSSQFQKLEESPPMSRFNWRREPDNSPPPPRRPQQGRTVIVPLLPSRYRPVVPLLGTPDSRVTSIEAGTSKSCATIPEDDEDDSCDAVDDLVSIDRTSMSVSDNCRRQFFSPSAYNLVLPQLPPEFQIPVPQYSAPDVPRPQTLITSRHVIHRSPSDGSAHSSLGTGSPADTTGSVSDSFYINSDVISSANGSGVGDLIAYSESDAQSKYILHRIEEESEADSALLLRDDKMPRSISQQFELMRQTS